MAAIQHFESFFDFLSLITNETNQYNPCHNYCCCRMLHKLTKVRQYSYCYVDALKASDEMRLERVFVRRER